MAEKKKQVYIEGTTQQIFDILKSAAPGLFGSKTLVDVQTFQGSDPSDTNQVALTFNVESDGVPGRLKNEIIRTSWGQAFGVLKTALPEQFGSYTVDQVVDFLIDSPSTPGNRRIVFREEEDDT